MKLEDIKGTAIHCKTRELYDKVKKKLKPTLSISWTGDNFCINVDGRAWCTLAWYQKEGYTIITAEEFLQANCSNKIHFNYLIL